MFSKKTFIIGAIALIALVGTFCVFDADSSELRILRFQGPVERTWESWKRQHNKTYGGPEEKARLNIFKKNYKFIQSHNAKNKSYTLALNKFADLSSKEFSALYTGASTAFRKQSNDCPAPSMKRGLKRPDTLDWRTQGRVGPVKDQAQCGSCWAFSTTGSLEGLASKSGQIPSFSEQQLVDCTTGTWGNFGCGGGWVQNSYAYILQKGIGLQADYPYKGVDQACQDSKITNPFKIGGCANVAVNDVEALKDAVQNGPVAIYLEADQMSFQFYSSGVLDDASCFAEGQIDHAVLLVGYDTTSWFVKNSWASSWGNKGYIQISTETTTNPAGICGILSTPNTYPL